MTATVLHATCELCPVDIVIMTVSYVFDSVTWKYYIIYNIIYNIGFVYPSPVIIYMGGNRHYIYSLSG